MNLPLNNLRSSSELSATLCLFVIKVSWDLKTYFSLFVTYASLKSAAAPFRPIKFLDKRFLSSARCVLHTRQTQICRDWMNVRKGRPILDWRSNCISTVSIVFIYHQLWLVLNVARQLKFSNFTHRSCSYCRDLTSLFSNLESKVSRVSVFHTSRNSKQRF